ncbi:MULTISPECIES: PIN domain-containing protein [Natronorubrum]|uniref:Ribonuclease VapC n=3 Tax=Natronorubrum TaxID=134813 RepID=L9WBU9_9EURY|nr:MULTISPECIES: PIN domain-containing protein [Natronorubrum]ELY46929.1 PilT protein domain protein [Natronorubrum bangense JCM 10635]QCC56535.1 PIN domain-containing protein [Natronorubrum bangense]QFU82312.1 PIN domain-containing protein [Natronorubrum aibiense]
MPRALIDTTVLFAAAYRRDSAHDDALPIVQGIDSGSLPEAVVLDYVLAETLNGLTTHAGHDAAVDLLDRIEENARFHIESLNMDALATGKALFRQHKPLSFVDACIIAYMQTEGLGYLYAFDDDFDAADDVYRLNAATDPYDPK